MVNTGKRYWPSELVTDLKDWPVAAFAAVTTAPVTIFPVGSVTIPASAPSLDWAHRLIVVNKPTTKMQMKVRMVDFMCLFLPPECFSVSWIFAHLLSLPLALHLDFIPAGERTSWKCTAIRLSASVYSTAQRKSPCEPLFNRGPLSERV